LNQDHKIMVAVKLNQRELNQDHTIMVKRLPLLGHAANFVKQCVILLCIKGRVHCFSMQVVINKCSPKP